MSQTNFVQGPSAPPYYFPPDFSFNMTSTPLAHPLPALPKQDMTGQSSMTHTLPLIQPMDLSRYGAFYSPMVSHNTLPISHDRMQHTPSSTPYSGSPLTGAQSNISTPEWNQNARVARAFPGLPNMMDPTQILLGSGMVGAPEPIKPTPLVSKEPIAEWKGYQYSQPVGAWDQAQLSEEDEKEKASQRSRRHVCPVCDKRFNRPSSLNTHMAVHTGAKPFQCTRPGCGRCFSVSSNLRRHARTHESKRARDKVQSGDDTELLPAPLGLSRSATFHSHSHSMGSRPYAYPASQPFNGHPMVQHQSHQSFGGYEYTQAPSLDFSALTATTSSTIQSATMSNTPLPSSIGSSATFDHNGVGLEKYSITRRSSSGDSKDGTDSGISVTTPKSPLDGYGFPGAKKEPETPRVLQ